MSNPETPLPPTPPPPPEKKHGCFFYGCITALVLLFLVGLGLFFGVRYAAYRVNGLVTEYTDTKPMVLPVVALPPEELKALTNRVAAFSLALDSHTNAAPLVLTATQVNALLAERPELATYKGKFFVSFDGGQAKAQISLPLDLLPKIPMIDTTGRHLNGSGTFDLEVNNGVLSVGLASLEVRGKPATELLAGLKGQNLAQALNGGTNVVFDQIESVQVTNGTLVIRPKSN